MAYRPHPTMESFGRAIDRNSADTVGALYALGMMLDERLSDLTEAVLGGQTIGKLNVHEETMTETIVPIEAGDNPLLETSELEDGSIAITVMRREDHTPAAQISMTKLRALELGQYYVHELGCEQCKGTGIVGGRVGGTVVCPRCKGAKLDPEA